MGFLDRLTAAFTGEAPIPEDDRVELELAEGFVERGDFAEAEARLRGLAERHPRVGAVARALGELRSRRGDYEGAVEAWGRAVDLDGRDALAWLGLGGALAALDRLEPAADAFRKALAFARDRALEGEARVGRGRIALREGDVARAVRELRLAVELLPQDGGAAADFGRALRAAGAPEAEQWLARAADDPDAPAALVIEAAAAQARPEAAEAILRAALARAAGPTSSAPLRAALAERLATAGRADEARVELEAAQLAAPDDLRVLRARRALAVAAGDHATALAAAERERLLGGKVNRETRLALAFAAQDRSTVEALARECSTDAAPGPLEAAVIRFAAGAATEDDAVTLAAVAPDDDARRFVARAFAPSPPPAGQLVGLLSWAHELAMKTPRLYPLAAAAARAREAFDRPLLLAVMGEFNAGKSSFVNALCGAEVAATGVTPTTATLNVLRHGEPAARVLYQDGRARELSIDAARALSVALASDESAASAIRGVEIFQPLPMLARVEIVDTPGLNSLRPEHEATARAFLYEADALVWLFSAGQAAKETERAALALARAAGHPVIGVVNKSDRVDEEERQALLGHVARQLGDLVDVVLPLSARDALAAGRRGDAQALAASGLPAVIAAVEERLVARAPELKRRSALAALQRFVDEATRLARATEAPAAPADVHLDAAWRSVRAALAAERLALRPRLESRFRVVSGELRDWLKPRGLLGVGPEPDESESAFVLDLLDEAVGQALAPTRAALLAAPGVREVGPAIPVDAAVDRFRAYARGVLAGGGVARLLGLWMTELRPDRETIARAFARVVPDPEPELFVPLERAIDRAFASARTEAAAARARAQARQVLEEERVMRPLAALADATSALA